MTVVNAICVVAGILGFFYGNLTSFGDGYEGKPLITDGALRGQIYYPTLFSVLAALAWTVLNVKVQGPEGEFSLFVMAAGMTLLTFAPSLTYRLGRYAGMKSGIPRR